MLTHPTWGLVKYIALLALVKIVPTHPHLVAVHQNDILSSLDDQDLSIRMRALELVTSMVSIPHHPSPHVFLQNKCLIRTSTGYTGELEVHCTALTLSLSATLRGPRKPQNSTPKCSSSTRASRIVINPICSSRCHSSKSQPRSRVSTHALPTYRLSLCTVRRRRLQ